MFYKVCFLTSAQRWWVICLLFRKCLCRCITPPAANPVTLIQIWAFFFLQSIWLVDLHGRWGWGWGGGGRFSLLARIQFLHINDLCGWPVSVPAPAALHLLAPTAYPIDPSHPALLCPTPFPRTLFFVFLPPLVADGTLSLQPWKPSCSW